MNQDLYFLKLECIVDINLILTITSICINLGGFHITTVLSTISYGVCMYIDLGMTENK